jgi:hypothetical protein
VRRSLQLHKCRCGSVCPACSCRVDLFGSLGWLCNADSPGRRSHQCSQGESQSCPIVQTQTQNSCITSSVRGSIMKICKLRLRCFPCCFAAEGPPARQPFTLNICGISVHSLYYLTELAYCLRSHLQNVLSVCMPYLSAGPGGAEHVGHRVGCVDQLGLDAEIASVDLDPQLPTRTNQPSSEQCARSMIVHTV